MRHIEAKAPVSDPAALVTSVLRLGATLAWDRHQRDVFFDVTDGYLKLRQTEGAPAELIASRLSPSEGPHPAETEVALIAEPKAVEALLRGRFGVRGVVERQRRCFRWRHTLIHLDVVEGLGPYLDLETVVADGADDDVAGHETRVVLEALGVGADQCEHRSYVELVATESPQQENG